MSTQIDVVGDISLVRFWNGKESALQFTPVGIRGYSQLTQKEIKELIEVLQNSFDREIYPSE